jgi:hypothetical protein
LFRKFGVRLLSACAAPAGSVQHNVTRIGDVPSQTNVLVWTATAVLTLLVNILGLVDKLALCARMTSAAAFTLINPQPNL